MAQAATTQNYTEFTDLPVGEVLRRTRIHYKRSIQDVENALRIRAEQIEAIEQGNVEKLPARVYAIGFVRSYAEFLGLDGDKIVHLFKTQSADQAVEPELHFPVGASESKAPPVWLAVICFVVLAIGIGIWMNVQSDSRQEIEAVPEVPENLKPETLAATPPSVEVQKPQEEQISAPAESIPEQPVAETPLETEPEPIPEPPKPKGIALNIKENSWVEIRDSRNRVILSQVLKAGDQYFVPDRDGLTMSIGNAVGVEISVDGEALDTLGGKGKVLRRIPLSAEALKERFAKPTPAPAENSVEIQAQ